MYPFVLTAFALLIFFGIEVKIRCLLNSHKLRQRHPKKADHDHTTYLFKSARDLIANSHYAEIVWANEIFYGEMQLSHEQSTASPIESRNFAGSYINIVNSERQTVSSISQNPKDWIMFGGSTVLCLEVNDSNTVSSCLQEIINSKTECNFQIHNYGQAGMKSKKIDHLFPLCFSRYPLASKVTVLFGVNDAGWIAGSNPSNMWQSLIDKGFDFVSKRLVLLDYLFLRLKSRRVCKASKTYAVSTLKKFRDFESTLKSRNIDCHFILQPNVFCKARPARSEFEFIHDADPLRIAGIHAAYMTYLSDGNDIVMSALNAFDHLEEAVFLDWCHVGVKGNQLIAKTIWSLVNGCNAGVEETNDALDLMLSNKRSALKLLRIAANKDEVPYNYPLY